MTKAVNLPATHLLITVKKRHIQQRMSRAGCPYDNAVMERYFNTLKHTCTNHYSFTTKERMDSTIYDFEEN